MKKLCRLLLLPACGLCTSAYVATGPGFKYKIYTDEVIVGTPFHFYLDFWNTGSYNIKLTSYSYTLYQTSTTGGKIKRNQKLGTSDSRLPYLCKKNVHFTLDLEIYPTGLTTSTYYSMDFVLTGSRSSGTVQLNYTCDSPYPAGEAYHGEDDPVTFVSDGSYTPHRTSYDLARKALTNNISYTYQYAITGFGDNAKQVLKPFHLKLTKTRLETNQTTSLAISDAILNVKGHGREFKAMADSTYGGGSTCYFNVESYFYAGSATLTLSSTYSVDCGTCLMHKGSPSKSRESSTKELFMPIGTNELSTYYPCVVNFKWDGDYFCIRTYDTNPHGGVGGTYAVEMESDS